MTTLIKTFLLTGALSLGLTAPAFAEAKQYTVEPTHSYAAFKINHIGFSWIRGVFNDLEGEFTFNPENPAKSHGTFTVGVDSLNTFHAERNAHLSSGDFFAVSEFPVATFTSTAYEKTGDNTALLHGKLTIKDVTQPVTFEVIEMAAAKDPWGNFRRAFSATTTIRLKDFNIDFELGPASEEATLIVNIEAVREGA
ncbi:MAG TPA: YceI family protein [Gammaproteobacteria bacterium]|nr:YceI family protein [Gammaproteobacteria bacterium]